MLDGFHEIGYSIPGPPGRLFEVASWWQLKVWRFLTIILTDKKMSRRWLADPMEHFNCRCTIKEPKKQGEDFG